MSVVVALLAMIVLLFITALFSAAESAFFSLSPSDIDDIKNSESKNDDKVLEAVYTLLNGHVANDDYELSSEDLKIISVRRKAILKGEEKIYTVSEVKKKLLKKLGK